MNTDANSLDRRVLRTRAAIRQALVELIEEKGFDALTVQDIASRADINRGTFYLHYHDKFDLLEQTELEIIHDFERILSQGGVIDLIDFKNTEHPLPAMVALFEYLLERAALMHAILGLKGDAAFQIKIKKALEINLLKPGFLNGLKKENFLAPPEYLLSYILSAHLGVIQVWLQRGCLESPREMALILSNLSVNGPLRAIGLNLA